MKRIIAVTATAFLLAACSDSDTTSSQDASLEPPNAAEQACLKDVTSTTNNPDVVLLGSEFSEAGTYVRIGVGANRAPWKCIAYSDGTTAGIESLTNEGIL